MEFFVTFVPFWLSGCGFLCYLSGSVIWPDWSSSDGTLGESSFSWDRRVRLALGMEVVMGRLTTSPIGGFGVAV
mgnify:FL=1